MSRPKKPDLWMPLYVGDYLADTGRLTTEQHGAYLLLLLDYWRSGALPDDDAILAGIVKASSERWLDLRSVLSPFFQVRGGRWHHKRVDAELEAAKTRQRKAHQRASEAARARWADRPATDAASNAVGNAQCNASSSAQALLEQCQSQSQSQSPSPAKITATGEQSSRGSRLPSDWRPSEVLAAWVSHERPDLELDAVVESFRDYWIAAPGAKGRRADWEATFRNWVRKKSATFTRRQEAMPA